MNRWESPQAVLRFSVALFVLSLVTPAGDGWWGWQMFVAVFWMLPQVALEGGGGFDDGTVLVLLSGAAANVFLFLSWAALGVRRLRVLAPWVAGCAMLLASVNLFRMPVLELGIGYWFWLGASVILLAGAWRMMAAERRKTNTVSA